MNSAFKIPEPFGTDYEYIMASRHGRLVMAAGQIAKTSHSDLHAVGQCGVEIDIPTAQKNAEICAGQALSWLYQQAGANEKLESILRMTVYIAVGDGIVDISSIADAASRVFIAALGDQGRHPRSVIGVSRLPRNAPVLLEVTAAISSNSTKKN